MNRLVHAVIAHSAGSIQAADDRTPYDPFEAFWERETSPGGEFDYLSAIPLFPNPHIRTNAFVIERQTFLDTVPSSMTTKKDTFLYESGPDNLTRQILRRGKKVVIVGSDGQSYSIDQWPESGTFRLGNQHNLLVQDNQTRAFETLTGAEKRVFAEITWGKDLS
jgi:hypothetical protein